MALHVIGVRHHSPACARLVAETIRRTRPRHVLVEGPSDMNERIAELLLPHRLPIALFTYRQDPDGSSRGTWSPFCDYSPEWVALRTAREVSATSLFIDLPAWHPAFEGEENRYSDRHVRHSDRLGELCARLGFEDSDALWDHLFEQPQDAAVLRERLAQYFAALRADEQGGPRDGPREDYMARFMAWAMADAGDRDVVVVCGGYHKPALERIWQNHAPERPSVPVASEGVRLGSYLVPFSFRRLDSFAGYASGMPSPKFYQTVWELGCEGAGEAMLFSAIRHLRAKRQTVAPADAIAAATLAQGLRSLRGHAALSRIDVLDGLSGALVKDALDAPLPWNRRGVLSARTEPLLVEVVNAFSGNAFGSLAPGTPQPPLIHDAQAELSRVGISFLRESQKLKVPLTSEAGAQKSAILHRLRVLGIPGVKLLRRPSFARAQTDLSEEWSIARLLETDAALTEAAVYGATLESAVLAKLEQRTREGDVLALAELLTDGVECALRALTERAITDMERVIGAEPSFEVLGAALLRLLSLQRGDALLGTGRHFDLTAVLRACFDRGLWLFEGIQGDSAPFHEGHVRAVRALHGVLHTGVVDPDRQRALELCQRRAHDAQAPAAMRGAALGFLWSARASDGEDPAVAMNEEAHAVAVLRASARPAFCGDFLAGLFALAREEVTRSHELLRAVDAMISGFLREDFMIALPAIRQAFAFFPPRERLTIAEAVLAMGGAQGRDPMELLKAPIDADVVQQGAKLDRAAAIVAARFGLLDAHDEGGGHERA